MSAYKLGINKVHAGTVGKQALLIWVYSSNNCMSTRSLEHNLQNQHFSSWPVTEAMGSMSTSVQRKPFRVGGKLLRSTESLHYLYNKDKSDHLWNILAVNHTIYVIMLADKMYMVSKLVKLVLILSFLRLLKISAAPYCTGFSPQLSSWTVCNFT